MKTDTVELGMVFVVRTSGDGYWSTKAAPVTITGLILIQHSDRGGELRARFDKRTWDIQADGLIYTDAAFLDRLKATLQGYRLDTSDLDYSEQGMQGDNYVSLDVGPKFITSWPGTLREVQSEQA